MKAVLELCGMAAAELETKALAIRPFAKLKRIQQ